MNYLQGGNRDADIENSLVDTAGEGEGGTEEREALKRVHQHT